MISLTANVRIPLEPPFSSHRVCGPRDARLSRVGGGFWALTPRLPPVYPTGGGLYLGWNAAFAHKSPAPDAEVPGPEERAAS